jgi:AMP-polyphosphate phosphotransferase
VTDKDYDKQLEHLQGRLNALFAKLKKRGRSAIAMFEGWDAAGKGGAIRRVTGALDARDYRVIPIAAPTDEEKQHHYLWRFWRHLPGHGGMSIYDRSWYGRVLVERVEGFCREDEWQRAYNEINDFEEQLVERGIVVAKFWLHIDPNEQLRRFKEREKTEFKRYKITEEDYRNRSKWPEYAVAVHDMVERTSTDIAPWHLVGANDKRVARLDVLEHLCHRIESSL